ncbi:hypothetical protein L596_009520 [Steinernema carpocapsae]|uniref:Uncharacterized protein n=1 Tax=Steinernema carpocapsae TaxID=34508 RepID=A0A4U5PG34_STECR|nr:hypothetical protein L596_009520 [Steinernema carpocapsae]
MAAATATSPTGFLNFAHLQEIIENDPDNLDQINYWYGQLTEFELEGNENKREVDILFRALKWIMQYEHAMAEDLKEVAEREAAEIAEREENWEQEREILKEELSTLRERITSQAGMNVTSEAFRDEIDMLKEENAHLKALNRDRDRELVDERNRSEELATRVEALEKEKNLALNNVALLILTQFQKYFLGSPARRHHPRAEKKPGKHEGRVQQRRMGGPKAEAEERAGDQVELSASGRVTVGYLRPI